MVDGERIDGKEGVVWQDPGTLKIFVTWVSLSLDSAETYELPSTGTTYLSAATSNGMQLDNTTHASADFKSGASQQQPKMQTSRTAVEIVYIVQGTVFWVLSCACVYVCGWWLVGTGCDRPITGGGFSSWAWVVD